jgi:hypothetical protein
VLGFVAGIILAIKAQPDLFREARLLPLAAIGLVAVPLTLLLNALEFMLSARLLRQQVALGAALEVTVVGSAANLLPIPGATLVRLAALKTGGALLGSTLAVTAVVAALSLALNLAYSGVWALAISRSPAAAAVMLAGGVAALAGAAFVSVRLFGRSSSIPGLIGVRLALIALDAARTWLAFIAIGDAAGFGQVSVITLSTALAAVLAVVPAGLGLREGIAALMAPLVGLGAASAFLATSLSRIIGLSVVGVLTMFLTIPRRPQA